MMSSAMPSAKNSCSGSALILVSGNTATDGLSGRGSEEPTTWGTTREVTPPTRYALIGWGASFSAFRKVHILCNNAGVGSRGGIDHIALDNWHWVLDVNLIGVVNGVRAFLPHMRAHGEGGHIVNTASMAGMVNSGAARG